MTVRETRMSIDLAREANFSLGCLRIQPSSREVMAAGATEVLEPRIMQVLVALARRRGEVVSRDDLIEECWGGRVVGEDAISRCIARVRRLAEVHGSFSVETIARVGYRLNENTLTASDGATAPVAATVHPGRSSRGLWIPIAAAVLIAAIYFGATQWRTVSAQRAQQDRIAAEVAALVQKDQYGQAFTLALPLLRSERLKHEPAFAEAWRQIVLPMRPLVAEAGATVYFKPYQDVDGPWVQAGVTPFAGTVAAPRGPLRIKVTKAGFRTGFFVVANPGRFHRDPDADVALYHVGNDPTEHGWIVEALRRRPGIVVMHEFVLHHLVSGITLARGDLEAYADALER